MTHGIDRATFVRRSKNQPTNTGGETEMQKAVRHMLIALTFVAIGLIALGSTTLSSAKSKSKRKGPPDTTKALRHARWGDNVTVTFPNGQFRYRSNGIPNAGLLSEYSVPNSGVLVPNATNSHVASSATSVKPQNYDFTFTASPRKAASPTKVFAGPVGVMISGALLFNPYEGDGKTVAVASNFTLKDSSGADVPFLDPCDGHPSPEPANAYHYHGLPRCVTSQVDKKKGPSHIIGVAFDGFPIYGDRDIDGKKVKIKKLDRCNGITSRTPEFPKGRGIYHYVLPDVTTAQSTMSCFTGTPATPSGFPPQTFATRAAAFCMLPTEASPAAEKKALRP
jgi:hypothetical protein